MARRSATERLRTAISALLGCGGLLFGAAAPADNLSTHFSLGMAYESNAPRAERSEDVRHDFSQSVRMSVSRSRLLDEHSGLDFTADAVYENRQFSALSNASAGAELAYRWQPVNGYSTPWYELAGSARIVRFANSPIRDGALASLSAAAGRNLTDRIALKAGAGLEKRWASSESVYDLNWRFAFLDLAYKLNRVSVYANVRRIWGDQVFSVQAEQESGTFRSKAVADDHAFGNEYYAYRLGGAATLAQVGAVAPLDESNSVSFSLSRYSASADGGHRYLDWLLGVTLVHRFD